VSLTSYGPRFQYLPKTIREISRQTRQPDLVLLNIDVNEKMEFCKLFGRISHDLNLELNFVENLGPGKKLIPALEKYPDADVITIDDDLKFNKHLFMELWKSHQENEDSIIATRCHIPKFLKCGYLAPYTEWNFDSKTFTQEDFPFVTAGAGALFPANSIHFDVLDTEKYKDLSFSTDDAWYWLHAIRKRTRIVRIEGFGDLNYVKGTQAKSLYWDGNAEIFNDFNIQNMAQIYGLFICQSGCHISSTDELLRNTLGRVDSERIVGRVLPLTQHQSNLDRYQLVRDLLQLEKSNSDAIELSKSKLQLLKLLVRGFLKSRY
jgi:hypothetical protein